MLTAVIAARVCEYAQSHCTDMLAVKCMLCELGLSKAVACTNQTARGRALGEGLGSVAERPAACGASALTFQLDGLAPVHFLEGKFHHF